MDTMLVPGVKRPTPVLLSENNDAMLSVARFSFSLLACARDHLESGASVGDTADCAMIISRDANIMRFHNVLRREPLVNKEIHTVSIS